VVWADTLESDIGSGGAEIGVDGKHSEEKSILKICFARLVKEEKEKPRF
jgi:hypothetical protein